MFGCQQGENQSTIIDEAAGFNLAFGLSLIVENSESQATGCATMLTAEEGFFIVAAPIDVMQQDGVRFVEWRGAHNGQKFERVVHSRFQILVTDLSLKIAIVRVYGATTTQPIALSHSDARVFHRGFIGYGSRPSSPRPIEALRVRVGGLAFARATPDMPGSEFFQAAGGIDFKMLGSPLVSEQGELAGVAVGHFWNSRLYCPADTLRKLMLGVK